MYSDAFKKYAESGKVAQMNPMVAEGLAFNQIGEDCYLTIHNLLKRELGPGNERLPEGFHYSGYRVFSAEQMFKWQSDKKSRHSPGVDIARSDYYMVEYLFRYRDSRGFEQEIKRPLLVPYINIFNILNVNGGQRLISAVWHQPGLGLVSDGFFVHFPFSKRITFKFENSLIGVHGSDERCYLPYTTTLKKRNGNATTNLPLVAYWLFCKYGFKGAIKKYLGVDLEIYRGDARANANLRLDQFTLVEPRHNRRVSREEEFIVAVPSEHLSRDIAKRTSKEKQLLTFISSLFYAQKFQPDHLDVDELNNPDVWMRVLGYSLGAKATDSEGQLYKDIEKHLVETERYYCERFHREMVVSGVDDLENTFDFLYHVIRSTVQAHNIPKSELSSLYGKCLKTVDYLFSGDGGLAQTINQIRWQLITLADKEFEETGSRFVSEGSINHIVNSKFYVSILNKITSGHGEVSHLSSTSECALFGMTTHVIDQTDATSKSKGGRKTLDLDDPSIHRHVSRLEAGNYGYVTKPQPFGDGVLNPYVTLGAHFEIKPNPKFIELTQRTQKDLAQRGNLK